MPTPWAPEWLTPNLLPLVLQCCFKILKTKYKRQNTHIFQAGVPQNLQSLPGDALDWVSWGGG